MCSAPMMLLSPRVEAQGTVRGSVQIIERAAKSSKDLDNAVVYLISETRNPLASAPLETKSVTMTGREFEPHVQILRGRGSVSYPNKDPYSHNVFSNSAQGAFDLGLYRSGSARSATFEQPGVYAIYCNIHARMVNFVLVVNTPYVARVNSHGVFQVGQVPSGSYTMHVWHERAPEMLQSIVVTDAQTTSVSVALDARSFVAAPHSDKFGKPYASMRADRY